MGIKVVLYSHDSVGLGHIRRNLALAHALSSGLDGVTGLLIAGRPEATRFAAPEGWDWLILPGVEPAPEGYRPRALQTGTDALLALRRDVFRSTLRAFRPDLVVIDRHPLGVGRELEQGLRMLRREQPRCRVVLGLRDVLDDPRRITEEWERVGGAAALRPLLDAVWVYGDPRVHDPATSGELPPAIGDLVVHTGYLAHGRVAGHRHDFTAPFMLTTVGGGSDGVELAAAAAAAPVPAGHRHLVVTGPQMPTADRRRVEAAAGPHTEVVRRVPDVLPLLQQATAVVSMAGYNTICEVLSTDTPALVAPRTQRRDEQRIRTSAMHRLGAIDTLSPWQVDPQTIGAWFAAQVGRRMRRTDIALDGLSRVPALATALIAGQPAELREAGERVAV